MSDTDMLDEAPTDLWIRPEPPKARRCVRPHTVRRREPTEPAVAPHAMSGRSCMLNLVDDLAALAAELHAEGKLEGIVDEEPRDA